MPVSDHHPRQCAGLVIERVENELMALDESSNHLHCINPLAAEMFEACDGTKSVEALANGLPGFRNLPNRDEVARLVVLELAEKGLVTREGLPESHRRLSRRKLLAGLGLAVPFVVTVLAPTPAQAATCFGIGHPCVVGHKDCCGTCEGTGGNGAAGVCI